MTSTVLPAAKLKQPFTMTAWLLTFFATYVALFTVVAVKSSLFFSSEVNNNQSGHFCNIDPNNSAWHDGGLVSAATNSPWFFVLATAGFAVETVLLASFSVAIKFRYWTFLQGLLWIERYSTRLQVSYILKPSQIPEMLWRISTCWLRSLPSVYLIGEMKCGTTALNEYLRQHPRIKTAGKQFVKETHFFSGRSIFRDNFEDCPWLYKSFFDLRWKNNTIQIDSTPQKLYLPWVAAKIKNMYPEAKIIICVRDPVHRAASNYQMLHSRKKELRTFEQAVEDEMSDCNTAVAERISQGGTISGLIRGCELVFPALDYAYLRRGKYVHGIRNWVNAFGTANVRVFKQHDLLTNPRHVLDEVCHLLRISTIEHLQPIETNKCVGKKLVLPVETVEKLSQYYHDANMALFNEFGIRF